MSSYEYALYAFRCQLAGLPNKRFMRWVAQALYQLWLPIYQLLAWFLAGKPGIRGWLWRLIHVREWQKSSAVSAVMWVFGTFIVYELVGRLGYGWEINVVVSLALDLASYLIHKRWIFHQRNASLWTSGSRNVATWLTFFGINVFLSWLVFQKLGLQPLWGRGVLGIYGFFINPLMFFIRDKGIFSKLSLKELFRHVRQLRRKTRA